MSVTISNCQEICSSPSNTSKSKMLYSFSKGDRFKSKTKILCERFYDPKQPNTRTCSFGFGNKFDLSKTTRVSPPCNTYNLSSEFESSKTERKGFGFGKGRQEMKMTGPLVQTFRNKNPGPGSYDSKSTLQKSAFSFNGKVQEVSKNKVPGPGFYPVTLSINEKGKYPTSKIKNILVRNFSTTIGRRRPSENNVPGPGKYETKAADLSPEGKYVLSKMENSLVRRFGFGNRSEVGDKKDTPGPGNYKLPSDFGHYVSSKMHRVGISTASPRSGGGKENKQNIV